MSEGLHVRRSTCLKVNMFVGQDVRRSTCLKVRMSEGPDVRRFNYQKIHIDNHFNFVTYNGNLTPNFPPFPLNGGGSGSGNWYVSNIIHISCQYVFSEIKPSQMTTFGRPTSE